MGSTDKYAPSKNIVFLLGAGASANFGLPVMRRFMSTAFDRYYELKQRQHHYSADPAENDSGLLESYERLFAFRQNCRRSLWAFNRDWDNIEEIYTQADLRRLAHLPDDLSSNHDALCNHIAWVIWDIYRGHPNSGSVWSEIVKHVFDAQLGLYPIIITTNYDLICETQLQSTEWYYPGFSLQTKNSLRELVFNTHTPVPYKDEGMVMQRVVPIIKLHGSVNWFRFRDGTKDHWFADTNLATYRHEVRQADILKRLILSHEGLKQKAGTFEYEPAIIPPMLGKGRDEHLFAQQWAAAINAIRNASQIWVIGYSFPRTDAFMSRLLAEGLADKDDFRRLYVADVIERDKHGIQSLLAQQLRENQFRYYQLDAGGAQMNPRALLYVLSTNGFAAWENNCESLSRVGPV